MGREVFHRCLDSAMVTDIKKELTRRSNTSKNTAGTQKTKLYVIDTTRELDWLMKDEYTGVHAIFIIT